MTDFEKLVDFPGRGLFGAQSPLSVAATKAALLLVLTVYGIGFAILTPLAQASASKGVAEGGDPILLIGP
jgi:hypothetical protein